MRLLPRTLLWRTVLLIGMLLVVSQIFWFQLFRLAEREPRVQQLSQQIASVVNLTRAALISVEPSKRRQFLIQLNEDEGIRIYPAILNEQSKQRDELPIIPLIRKEIRRQLGANTDLVMEREEFQAIWVSFYIEDHKYWVAIPRAKVERQLAMQWIGWAALAFALSTIGAYWIVSRINRPLRHLANAAHEIGKGSTPSALKENGPAEIRALSSAFNHMNEDLQRLNKDRTLLLAGVSHDLRTPLTRLRLAVEMTDHATDPAMRNGMITDIEDMDAIIQQFLDFARNGENETAQAGDLNNLISEASMKFSQGEHTVTCELGSLPSLSFRPLAMQRLINNLIANALLYGSPHIEVKTQYVDSITVISVLDRGLGIPETEAERLLQPFTRIDASRTGKVGSGLGLAIVDKIAKLHGGNIQLLPRTGGGLEARVSLQLKLSA